MKKIFLILLTVVTLNSSAIFFVPLARAGDKEKSAHIVAYYFHGTARCPTCHRLEKYSKEAIETSFKDALMSGKLEFKIINVDDKGNEHYSNDYQLYTKSLILSLVKDGKQIKWKNLDKIWEYVGNKQKFLEYVTTEINSFLKDIQ